MTLQELVSNYNFHDSYFESITYEKESKRLTLQIYFCFWLQDNYNESDPDNGIISVIFENADSLSCDTTNINCDIFSILSIELNNNTICFKLIDDLNSDYTEFTFTASSVKILF